jgi:uncharacterized membrane protein YbaN (DUF454 family)
MLFRRRPRFRQRSMRNGAIVSCVTLSCSACHYYVAWYYFPPTASWIWLLPVWLLTLSLSRGSVIRFRPPLMVTLPLVAFGLLGIGNLLSIVGLLQLTLCIIPTALNWRSHNSTPWSARRIALLFMLLFVLAASYNFRVCWSMTNEQRLQVVPEHARGGKGFFSLLPV